MFGLDRASIVYLVEQLKGRSRLKNYKFWFAQTAGQNEEDGDLEENQTGKEYMARVKYGCLLNEGWGVATEKLKY